MERYLRLFAFAVLALSSLLLGGCNGDRAWRYDPGIPVQVTGLKAQQGNQMVTLSWTANHLATSYNIYYVSDATADHVTRENAIKLNASTSPRVIGQLVNGTTYHFMITALNKDGESIDSAEVSAVPAPPSSADLVGTWYFHTLVTGPDARWERGTLTVDANSGATISDFEDSSGSTTPPPGFFLLVDENGAVSQAGANAWVDFHGTIGSRKNMMLATYSPSLQSRALTVFQKKKDSSLGEIDVKDLNVPDVTTDFTKEQLVATLQNDPNPLTRPVSQYLWAQFDAQTKQTLTSPTTTTAENSFSKQSSALVSALNTVLHGASLYDATRFAGVTLLPEAAALLAKNPQGDELVHLNRLLLASAYPTLIYTDYSIEDISGTGSGQNPYDIYIQGNGPTRYAYHQLYSGANTEWEYCNAKVGQHGYMYTEQYKDVIYWDFSTPDSKTVNYDFFWKCTSLGVTEDGVVSEYWNFVNVVDPVISPTFNGLTPKVPHDVVFKGRMTADKTVVVGVGTRSDPYGNNRQYFLRIVQLCFKPADQVLPSPTLADLVGSYRFHKLSSTVPAGSTPGTASWAYGTISVTAFGVTAFPSYSDSAGNSWLSDTFALSYYPDAPRNPDGKIYSDFANFASPIQDATLRYFKLDANGIPVRDANGKPIPLHQYYDYVSNTFGQYISTDSSLWRKEDTSLEYANEHGSLSLSRDLFVMTRTDASGYSMLVGLK